MNLRDFMKAGHTPTLFCAFLYFDISFMVWVILGALANAIVPDPDFKLSETQRGMMLALPLLSGAMLRPILGWMTDHFGARQTALIGMTLTMAPLLLGWLWVDSYTKVLLVGVLLGVAGASFAAALPLASRWYPPQFQGLAMGIAGAGNSGTALATLFGPLLALQFGWHAVFGLAIIPMALTWLCFFVLAKDSPTQPAPKTLAEYGKVLGYADTWWFCLFYSVTFGGFVGLAVFLNSFFRVQYGESPVVAGMFATICVISGSFLRPVGGYLADRFGGIRALTMLYGGVAATMIGLGMVPDHLYFGAAMLFLCMGFLGMGNGSVFQLVPLRFPKEIGLMTGIVGAAGGAGGFFVPSMLGYLKDQTGAFSGGFFAFAGMGVLCSITLLIVSRSWSFVSQSGKAVIDNEPVATESVPAPQPAEATA